jgi:hypothetical protein
MVIRKRIASFRPDFVEPGHRAVGQQVYGYLPTEFPRVSDFAAYVSDSAPARYRLEVSRIRPPFVIKYAKPRSVENTVSTDSLMQHRPAGTVFLPNMLDTELTREPGFQGEIFG